MRHAVNFSLKGQNNAEFITESFDSVDTFVQTAMSRYGAFANRRGRFVSGDRRRLLTAWSGLDENQKTAETFVQMFNGTYEDETGTALKTKIKQGKKSSFIERVYQEVTTMALHQAQHEAGVATDASTRAEELALSQRHHDAIVTERDALRENSAESEQYLAERDQYIERTKAAESAQHAAERALDKEQAAHERTRGAAQVVQSDTAQQLASTLETAQSRAVKIDELETALASAQREVGALSATLQDRAAEVLRLQGEGDVQVETGSDIAERLQQELLAKAALQEKLDAAIQRAETAERGLEAVAQGTSRDDAATRTLAERLQVAETSLRAQKQVNSDLVSQLDTAHDNVARLERRVNVLERLVNFFANAFKKLGSLILKKKTSRFAITKVEAEATNVGEAVQSVHQQLVEAGHARKGDIRQVLGGKRARATDEYQSVLGMVLDRDTKPVVEQSHDGVSVDVATLPKASEVNFTKSDDLVFSRGRSERRKTRRGRKAKTTAEAQVQAQDTTPKPGSGQ